MTKFVVKRIYEPVAEGDGYRVLLDRLWPRGVSKERAALDEWAKELAPSNELRKWFGHEPEKFDEFSKRYIAELENNPLLVATLTSWREHPTVTLLYGARDESANEAIVMRDYLVHLPLIDKKKGREEV